MASSSIASSRISNSRFDVFISHRGPEVKKTLASHLYHRLLWHGFRVFLDHEELEEGQNLNSQIEGAIATASVQVAIFSPRYAESKWCLEELVLMLKSGSPVIPVFYGVKPLELRWTQDTNHGVYSQALLTHEKNGRYDLQTIANWRSALVEVSYLCGFELEAFNGDEGELLNKLVQRVQKMVRKPALDVATYPTGLDEKLKDFERSVSFQVESKETQVVGIVGSGGIGKTTLAKEFYNRHRKDYAVSCFLFDVRGCSLTSLQSKLFSELTGHDELMYSIDQGITMLKRHLWYSKAIIVLDDVDHVDQLRALFSPIKDVLPCGSLILVTSRNKDFLTTSRIVGSSIYKLAGLDRRHSEELFCSHAFHQPQPVVGFEEVAGQFLEVCDGLPISLKVIGALLHGKDVEYWEGHLRKISQVLPNDIHNTLKSSYDTLDEQEKEIFLDIACFFRGEDKDVAIRIWEVSGWEGCLNIQNLVNKCLIEINSQNCIKMHDHLRDLGRALAEKEPPGRWRRLSCSTHDLLYNNVSHQSSVRGISIVQRRFNQLLEDPAALGNRFIDFIFRIRFLDFIFSNRFVDMGHRFIHFIFNNRSIHMKELQLLRAEGDCLRSISNLLRHSELLWLCWDKYPYTSLPFWLPTKNLRVLEVNQGKLETLWHESEAPLQLRKLNIGATLVRVPKSIRYLKHLEKIELHDIIETLPKAVFHLSTLKHLKLRTRMPLPDSCWNLTNLQHIDLSGCTDLQMLPDSLGNSTILKHISLSGCLGFQMLPPWLGNLVQLEHLDLQGTKIKEL